MDHAPASHDASLSNPKDKCNEDIFKLMCFITFSGVIHAAAYCVITYNFSTKKQGREEETEAKLIISNLLARGVVLRGRSLVQGLSEKWLDEGKLKVFDLPAVASIGSKSDVLGLGFSSILGTKELME